MSFFATIGVKITEENMEQFEAACNELGLDLQVENGAYFLYDRATGIWNSLQRQDDGSFQVWADTDRKYNRLMDRLGTGYEKLFQGYSRNVAVYLAEQQGYSLMEEETCSDGSLLLRVAVGG